MKMNYVFALVGKSGTGKTTLSKVIGRELSIPVHVTYTTRHPRHTERDGVDYHFVTVDEFTDIEMVEQVEFDGNWYGTGKQSFEQIMHDNKASIIVVEETGLKRLQSLYGKKIIAILLEMEGVTRFELLTRRDGKQAARKRWGTDLRLRFSEVKINHTIYEDGENWIEVKNEITKIIRKKLKQ